VFDRWKEVKLIIVFECFVSFVEYVVVDRAFACDRSA
jgi:hypothetical protein